MQLPKEVDIVPFQSGDSFLYTLTMVLQGPFLSEHGFRFCQQLQIWDIGPSLEIDVDEADWLGLRSQPSLSFATLLIEFWAWFSDFFLSSVIGNESLSMLPIRPSNFHILSYVGG